MSSLIETLIETIAKDLLEIENLEDSKMRRKELSILLGRITSAKKLTQEDPVLSGKVKELETKIQKLR